VSYINPIVNVDCVKTLDIGWMKDYTKNGRWGEISVILYLEYYLPECLPLCFPRLSSDFSG
jgi:hypothetical protein